MITTTHTPGPWEVHEYGDGDSLAIHYSDNDRICFMATHGGSQAQWEAIQANARLIAASPDLLAMLHCAENWLREYDMQNSPDSGAHELLRDIRAAIAKATGEA
jgi:hypothetical protein